MKTMESYRKQCLNQQTELRRIMARPERHDEAIRLFLSQHALLHSARMAATEPWSFEDEILEGMTVEHIRQVPPKEEHSVAWILWHIARCEDITMNLLVAGSPQVLNQEGRLQKMNATICHTGNVMSEEEITSFSSAIDIPALREYRMAVGRRTRQVVQDLGPEDLKRKVEPARIQKVWDEGAVLEGAGGIVDYWSKRDIAGLLLMPASRHNLTHLNEALDIKKRF